MTEYKIDNATVRIHGNADPEKVRSATEKYLKKVVRSKKNEIQVKAERSKSSHQ